MSGSWITDFKDFGSAWFVSDFWLEWGAVFCLSICMQRQIYYEANPTKRLYPNLYVLPVGAPGTGKGELIEAMRTVLSPLERFTFAPNSATRAAMLDYMRDNLVSRQVGGRLHISAECIALNEELANLIPENDTWYLSTMNELYDCRNRYEARTRTDGKVELESPYAAVFAAAQPQFLALTFPEQAWGMGFMSRCIMVYSGDKQRRANLFDFAERDWGARDRLAGYLETITNMSGKITWSPEAKRIIQAWYDADMPPKPSHPRLVSYINRRILHLYKLAMVHAMADDHSMYIRGEHVEQALDLLFRTESYMPQIFLEMAGSAMNSAMLDVANIIQAFYVKFSKPLEEAKVIQLLAQRMPPNQITSAMNTMISGGLIKTSGNQPPGLRQLVPGTVRDSKLDSLDA